MAIIKSTLGKQLVDLLLRSLELGGCLLASVISRSLLGCACELGVCFIQLLAELLFDLA